jgi:hypothetical protein
MQTENLKLFIKLIQALGLGVTLLSSFYGGVYLFGGHWEYAFPVSIICVVALYYLVIYFCQAKEARRKKGYQPLFYYLFGAYGVLSIFLSFLVLHFYNVEINEKDEIQKIGMNKLYGLKSVYKNFDEEADSLFVTMSYVVLGDINKSINHGTPLMDFSEAPYELNSDAIERLKAAASVNKLSDALGQIMGQRRNRLSAKKVNLLGQTDKEYFGQNELYIKNWNRLGITATLNDLDQRIINDYKQLNGELEKVSGGTYSITVSTSEFLKNSLLNEPLNLAGKHMGIMTFIVLLFFQLLILLPYFLTKGRSYGI